MRKGKFSAGDRVRLDLGTDASFAPKGLKRWDKCEFEIDSVKCILANRTNTNRWFFYTLKCCRSPKGKPYTVIEDWLTEL